MKNDQVKICPRCNNNFDCFGDKDCWCEQVQITSKKMKSILMKFDDCLCPKCLNDEIQLED